MNRRLTVVFVLITLLAACGGQPAAQPTTAPAAPTAQPTTAPAATSVTATTAPTANAYPRTVTDYSGQKVTFEKRPERVMLSTYRYVLDGLLLLDVTPLAYAAWDSETLPLWTQQTLNERGINLINVNGGTYPAPINFEQLATLKPDLIIIPSIDGKRENIEELSLFEKIAPVFLVNYNDVDGSRLRMLAEVFAAERKAAEVEARDAELFQQITPPPVGTELAVGFGYKDGGVASQVYNGGGASELRVLERAGFTIKDYGRPAGERDFTLAEENLTMLDADMLWNVAPYPGDNSPNDFVTSPVVQNLNVYKEGRYRSLNADQSQAILFWTPLATPFLVETLNELVASYNFPAGAAADAEAAYPRTITDGAGNQVTIPAAPQRIAVIDPLASLEALLSLGVAPAQIGQRSFVAAYTGDPLKQWPWLEAALVEAGANPERISADETNLEAIAGAQPDLIIGQPFWVNEQRDLLNKIAPTIVTPGANVRSSITLLGNVLGMENKAAQVLADWDTRLKAEVEGLVPPGKTVAIIRTDGEGTFTVFNTAGYGPYDMMTRAGFTLSDVLATADKNANGLGSNFSLERLDVLAEADVIVVLGFSVEATDQLLVNPIFKQLPAVQAGRVTRIKQGPVAQAFAALSPLNLDTVLPVIKEAAAFAQ
jgi:iron complex transport system substrate-binding protein